MRKIINGKRFDTEKSERIGGYSYANPSDFNYISEALYITPRSKQFFIAGEGGANTKYRESVSNNSWSGGEKIFPLSIKDAFAWAQTYLTTEEVERWFYGLIDEA